LLGSGTWHAQNGKLSFTSAMTTSASTVFNADSGATIEFVANGNAIAGSTTFSGSGTHRIASNTTFAAGAISVPGSFILTNGVTITFNSVSITGTTTWD